MSKAPRVTPNVKTMVGVGLLLVLALFVAWFGNRVMQEGNRGPAGTPEVGVEPKGTPLRTVTLYFGDRSGAGLRAERREILAHADRGGDVAAMMGELAAGPLTGLEPVLPPGTKVRHVFVDATGGVYLDFSAEIRSGFTGALPQEMRALTAIARTLSRNFAELRSFVILIDGKPAATLAGHLDISRPLTLAEWD